MFCGKTGAKRETQKIAPDTGVHSSPYLTKELNTRNLLLAILQCQQNSARLKTAS